MSKKIKVLYYIVMFLPLLFAMSSLSILPDQIPAHYGVDGQVTRWGSKYETLILPIMIILFGLFMIWMAKIVGKKERFGKNNEKSMILNGILFLILFNILNCYILYTAVHKVDHLSKVSISIEQLGMGSLGIALIIIGNIMPKLKKNSIIGIRTTGSMKNEITWKKSQKFGGIAMMITGAVIVVICCLLKGQLAGIISLVLIVLMLVLDLIYTSSIGKKYGEEEHEN